MAILTPTEIHGRVAWLGLCRERAEGLESASVATVRAGFAGLEGDAHSGLTRRACTRVLRQYPRGAEIRNTRQISIVSVEELAEIGDALGLGAPLRPEWVGANIALEGVPRLSQVSPSARLIFENGVSLTIDMENAPCRFPGDVIERSHPGKGRAFERFARGKRGLTAWVEREGDLAVGAGCRLHLPPQRVYAPDQFDF